jgi:hypothetical protein
MPIKAIFASVTSMQNKNNLKIGDFKRHGEPGSFQHYFAHMLPNGDEICLEACMGGYCIARYDKNKNILSDEKICTNFGDMMETQIMGGFSVRSGEALEKAVEIANTLV